MLMGNRTALAANRNTDFVQASASKLAHRKATAAPSPSRPRECRTAETAMLDNVSAVLDLMRNGPAKYQNAELGNRPAQQIRAVCNCMKARLKSSLPPPTRP